MEYDNTWGSALSRPLKFVVTDSESFPGKHAWYLVDGRGVMRTESVGYARARDARRAAWGFIESLGFEPVEVEEE